MHYQAAPHEEIKLIRCVAGSVFDVLVDIRPDSPTFRRWAGFELSAANGIALYVPGGIAHGFQALEDESTLHYLMSEFHHPESSRGIAYDDPALHIPWPIANPVVSDNDRQNPRLG
jgi:dTDP-4-dehydrorhamnose 3,5-epimerase